MPKATKANRATLERLDVKAGGLMMQIYKATPRDDVRFSDCIKLAPPETVAAYEAARDAWRAYQEDMIGQGRAWRTSGGAFIWN
jgi:hypothetical protein